MHDDQLASEADAQAGLAHVATASFLASRVVPTGGYAVALAGGVALARAAQLAGMRMGYGASLAAMLQSIAVLGPSRVSVPLTQALSAPLLGRLHEHGAHLAAQIGACAAIRAGDQTLFTLFYIWIVGGVEAYAATYDVLAGRIPGVPDGTTAALVATALVLVAWTAFASVVQVLTYRAALRGWPAAPAEPSAGGAGPGAGAAATPRAQSAGGRQPRYDPRAVTLAALLAFGVLLATTEWIVLAGVCGWLAVAWLTARAEAAPIRAGLALAALLAGGVLAFGLIGGLDMELTLRRTLRAALLVLVATWLRATAGEAGVRETARRTLWRLRRMPAMAEAAHMLDRLGAGGALGASGRALVAQMHGVRRRPVPLARAVLRWVAAEARAFRTPPPAAARGALCTTWRDAALVAAVIGLAAAAVLSSG
ncbi:MAG: hypothetical protein Q8K79_09500 [Solirubrobacteraceae bacterium]|nr:hypothetical protein [Solirubrobacteraceae bacterium]